jgi:hypothetical protein
LADRTAGQCEHIMGSVVHAAIGAIQSPLVHNTGLAEERLRALVAAAARAILGIGG